MAYYLGIFLLGTFYKDLVIIVSHLHRIKANDLADGLFDRKIAEVAGDSEVLQFIIDEINGLIVGGCIQVFEYL